MRRLLTELRRSHARADVEAALASVTVHIAEEVATLSREPGDVTLFERAPRHVATARLAPGVYARTPTTDARVRLLDRAASLANAVHVHVPLVSDGTHRGRLAIDLPRILLRAAGLEAAEPGDRFERGFAHASFDDEAIIEEAARAGLRFVERRGAWVYLERSTEPAHERAEPFALEVFRVSRIIRRAERLRLGSPPELAVRTMRELGRSARRRGPIARARLRRAVGWVDAAYPGSGPNCFRRVLVEVGLDAGAAGETLVFGLDVGRTGHVAFKESEDRAFDVAFEVGP